MISTSLFEALFCLVFKWHCSGVYVPSVYMMRKVMESGNLESDEMPLWPDDEAEM